jgi:hypothetical protein
MSTKNTRNQDSGGGDTTTWAANPAIQNVNIDGYNVTNVSNIILEKINGISYPQTIGTTGQVLSISSTANTVYWKNDIAGDTSVWAQFPATQDVDLSNYSILNISNISASTLNVSTDIYIQGVSISSSISNISSDLSSLTSTVADLSSYTYSISGAEKWAQFPATQDVDLSNYSISNISNISASTLNVSTDIYIQGVSISSSISNISSDISSLTSTVADLSSYTYSISGAEKWAQFPAIQDVNLSGYSISNINSAFLSNNLTVSGLATLSGAAIHNGLSVSGLATLSSLLILNNISGVREINSVDVNIHLGSNIIAIGEGSTTTNTGTNIVAFGPDAARNNTASTVIAIGLSAGVSNSSSNSIMIGLSAGAANKGSNLVAIGRSVGLNNSAANVVAIGTDVGRNLTATLGDSVLIGRLVANNASGDTVVGIGSNVLSNNKGGAVVAIGGGVLTNNTGNNVVALGVNLGSNNTGNDTIFLGRGCGISNTGNTVVGMGLQSCENNTGANVAVLSSFQGGRLNTGSGVVGMGFNVVYGNTGSSVAALGSFAGYLNTGNQIVALGTSAATNNSGANVVVIGNAAGIRNTGAHVVGLGSNAAYENTGSNVIAIGNRAGYLNTGSNSIFLGSNPNTAITNASSNQMIVYSVNGNSNALRVLLDSNYLGINCNTPLYTLDVNGSANINGHATLSTATILNNISVNRLNSITYPTSGASSGNVLTISSTPATAYWAPTPTAQVYGSFLYTLSMNIATDPVGIPLNATDISLGCQILNTSGIQVLHNGIYKTSFSLQLKHVGGGDVITYMWVRKNGIDVSNSGGQVRLKGTGDEIFPYCEYILPLSANDYVQLFAKTSTATVSAVADSVTGVPYIPSLVFNIFKLA